MDEGGYVLFSHPSRGFYELPFDLGNVLRNNAEKQECVDYALRTVHHTWHTKSGQLQVNDDDLEIVNIPNTNAYIAAHRSVASSASCSCSSTINSCSDSSCTCPCQERMTTSQYDLCTNEFYSSGKSVLGCVGQNATERDLPEQPQVSPEPACFTQSDDCSIMTTEWLCLLHVPQCSWCSESPGGATACMEQNLCFDSMTDSSNQGKNSGSQVALIAGILVAVIVVAIVVVFVLLWRTERLPFVQKYNTEPIYQTPAEYLSTGIDGVGMARISNPDGSKGNGPMM